MTQPTTTGPTTDTTTTQDGVVDMATPATTVDNTEVDDATPNSEAAKYRIKLRETEAERDTLAERITAMQRRECEAAAAEILQIPADLWDLGKADPAGFYTDDGLLNDAELRAAAGALVEQRPGLAKTDRTAKPKQWGQASGQMPGGGASWDMVVKGS